MNKLPTPQTLVCYNSLGEVVIDEEISEAYFGQDFIRYYKEDVPYQIQNLECFTREIAL